MTTIETKTPRLRTLGTPLAVLAGSAVLAVVTVGVGQDVDPTAPSPYDVGPSPTLGLTAPIMDEKTQILFEGESWALWHQRDGEPSTWTVTEEGYVIVGPGDAITTPVARDFQLHIEFLCPPMLDKKGQARANSGVYLHGRYEIQVLDSYGLEPGMGDCGAIYSIAPPLRNACLPPGEWQTYDVVFRAPRFDDKGNVTDSAYVTVLQNGVVIHNHQKIPTPTLAGLGKDILKEGPLLLQDHGNPVMYRNIWLREI